MLKRFDIYVLPVFNPDGYAYTHQGPGTRLWRKTRSKQENGCYGADPNRNWSIQWDSSELLS